MNRLQIKSNPKILDKVISKFLNSQEFKNMLVVDKYYNAENQVILNRKKMMLLYNEKEEQYITPDLSKANHKVIHGFLFELINQAKNYICGKPVKISFKDNVKPDDKLKVILDDILYKYNAWGLFNQENVKNAQKYTSAWSRLVIDKEAHLRLINVDTKEVIPFYDDLGDLECLVRLFENVEYDENGAEVTRKYAEVYDEMFKDLYIKKGSKFELVQADMPLLDKYVEYEVEDGIVQINSIPLSWGKIPWVEWKFNNDSIDALKPIKSFIDLLDINLSDLANNVDDIQELIWILENYEGQSIQEFMEDLKIKKAINVGEGGSVKTESAEIPFEARMKLYDACEKNIYRFGRGIDFAKRDQLGNSTGVALKWSYGPLDAKADEIEQNGQHALDKLFNLIFTYLSHTGLNLNEIDSNDLEFSFDRTMITNEKEIIESVIRSTTLLSLKTALDKHPMVDDTDEELLRLLDPVFGKQEEVNDDSTANKSNDGEEKSNEGDAGSKED